MTPADVLGWVDLSWRVGSAVAGAVMSGISRGDLSVLDSRISDLLAGELRTTLALRAADAAAAAKLGPLPGR